jgi:signal transduction histidine kinase
MRDILISQSSGSVVLHNRKKDGTIFINRIDLSPVFDESGKLAEYIGLQTDITEEVNLRNGMARAQRMESLGQLAAGMAHDFNNSLQIILNSAQLSLLELEEGSDTREDLSTIEQAAQHASKLVADLLTFARAKTTEQTEFDLVEKLESMSGMMRALMSGRGSLALSMPTAPVTVIGDPRQVEQVVLNLVSNARDAIAADGHVEVSVEFEGPYYDHKAVIRVSDDGSGMTREQQERAFEPFFSSKGEAGTGLGLATSFGIITGMGGTIDIESAPGEGTTVICRLPLASTSEQPARV